MQTIWTKCHNEAATATATAAAAAAAAEAAEGCTKLFDVVWGTVARLASCTLDHARRGTGSATLMKRLSGSCCTCPLRLPLPLLQSMMPAIWAHTHSYGREGVMQLLLLLGECQACPGNDFESVGQMSYLKMLLAQVIKGNCTKFLSVIDNQNWII